MEKELTPKIAKKIIETVGGQGNPPEYGFQFFSTGLEPYLKILEEEYFQTFISEGGSAFKMIIGIYGEGKTHFLYSIRELAWDYNYMAAYISLSPERTPFHKLQEVYKAVVNSLVYTQEPEKLLSGYEKGIEAVIKKWYADIYKLYSEKFFEDELESEIYQYVNSINNFESISFTNAIKEAFKALLEKRDDDFSLIIQWLYGENPPKNLLKKYKIFEKIDKSTAFKMIRSLVEWIKQINYKGLIVLLDEAETTSSMSSRQKSVLLNNLRELIDECGNSNFRSTMWFYAVTDENFLEGRTQIYEALRQRLSTEFNQEFNPTGIKIYMGRLPIDQVELLKTIGQKLAVTYEMAYNVKFKSDILEKTIENIALEAYDRKIGGSFKRTFVQSIIKAFHLLKKSDKPITPVDIEM